MDKQLKDKAIRVKGGKEYVEVSHRVNYFNENYPEGSITTDLEYVIEGDKPLFVVKATVDTGKGQIFTGLSQAKLGTGGANQEAALENAETSAVGRALGFMGIGVIDSIATVDELRKANIKISVDDL
jgi:hypothetical protein